MDLLMPYGSGHDEDLMEEHKPRRGLKLLRFILAGAGIFVLWFILTSLILIKPYLLWMLVVLAILLSIHKCNAAFTKAHNEYHED